MLAADRRAQTAAADAPERDLRQIAAWREQLGDHYAERIAEMEAKAEFVREYEDGLVGDVPGVERAVEADTDDFVIEDDYGCQAITSVDKLDPVERIRLLATLIRSVETLVEDHPEQFDSWRPELAMLTRRFSAEAAWIAKTTGVRYRVITRDTRDLLVIDMVSLFVSQIFEQTEWEAAQVHALHAIRLRQEGREAEARRREEAAARNWHLAKLHHQSVNQGLRLLFPPEATWHRVPFVQPCGQRLRPAAAHTRARRARAITRSASRGGDSGDSDPPGGSAKPPPAVAGGGESGSANRRSRGSQLEVTKAATRA